VEVDAVPARVSVGINTAEPGGRHGPDPHNPSASRRSPGGAGPAHAIRGGPAVL